MNQNQKRKPTADELLRESLGRCEFCSERATGFVYVEPRRRACCGSCGVMMGGYATSTKGVDARDAKTPDELAAARRQRQGGKGRFRR